MIYISRPLNAASLIICMLLSTCNLTGNKKERQEGVIELRDVMFNIMQGPADSSGYLILSKKSWFKDSLEISEEKTLYIKTDTAHHTSREFKLNCYLFKNTASGIVFQYMHFSDTAKPVKRFAISDSAKLMGGGFYYPPSHEPNSKIQKLYYLPDTVISSITYKRVVQAMPIPKDTIFDIYFLRCDIGKSIASRYNLNDSVNKMSNCTAVKAMREHSLEKKKMILSSEIIILSNQLSAEQTKVFTAWQGNASNSRYKTRSPL